MQTNEKQMITVKTIEKPMTTNENKRKNNAKPMENKGFL